MFKFTVAVIFAIIACASAKPGLIGAPFAYAAPAAVVAAPAPFVTATSSQVIARNYNGIASAPIVAPVVKTVTPVATRFVAAPAAYTAPIVSRYATAYSTPFAYSAPVVAKYNAVAAPLSYSSPLAYSAPLTYAAAVPALW